MGIAGKLIRKAAKRTVNRVMDKVGGRMVSGMADTSADAPSATFEPKRNLYEKLRKGEVDGDSGEE